MVLHADRNVTNNGKIRAASPALVVLLLAALALAVFQSCGSSSSTPSPVRRTLTVALSGPGGPITSVPAGINCGATCTADYDDGTVVQLTLVLGGNTFMGWQDACAGSGPTCQVTMDQARSTTAMTTPPIVIPPIVIP